MKKPKRIPKFKTEDEERAFWASADSTEHFDYSKPSELNLSNLKPTTTTISLRIPVSLLDELKIQANKRDVPYQSFMKILLSESIERIHRQ